jgi:hypothetical protein
MARIYAEMQKSSSEGDLIYEALVNPVPNLSYDYKPDAIMKKNNNLGANFLLASMTALISSCQGVNHLFKAHFWIGILIIGIIVLLIIGVVIKMTAKVPE